MSADNSPQGGAAISTKRDCFIVYVYCSMTRWFAVLMLNAWIDWWRKQSCQTIHCVFDVYLGLCELNLVMRSSIERVCGMLVSHQLCLRINVPTIPRVLDTVTLKVIHKCIQYSRDLNIYLCILPDHHVCLALSLQWFRVVPYVTPLLRLPLAGSRSPSLYPGTAYKTRAIKRAAITSTIYTFFLTKDI